MALSSAGYHLLLNPSAEFLISIIVFSISKIRIWFFLIDVDSLVRFPIFLSFLHHFLEHIHKLFKIPYPIILICASKVGVFLLTGFP